MISYIIRCRIKKIYAWKSDHYKQWAQGQVYSGQDHYKHVFYYGFPKKLLIGLQKGVEWNSEQVFQTLYVQLSWSLKKVI